MTRRQRVSQYRRGTNQYKTKTQNHWKTWLWGYLIFIVSVGVVYNLGKVDSAHATQEIVSPLPEQVSDSPPSTKVESDIPVGEEGETEEPSDPTVEEIEDYVRTIFGKDARVAIAVSHKECNPQNTQYPACVLHTEHEYSVGIFQINLFNTRHWIHAQKVPGKTMEEKIEWLKNPFHNTLVAFKIFKDSGFGPWTAYTNGAYLQELEGGE